jgi:hypothetical protein
MTRSQFDPHLFVVPSQELLKPRRSAAALECQLALDGVSGAAVRVNTKVHTSRVLLVIQSLGSLSSTFAAYECRSVSTRPPYTPSPSVPPAMPGPRGAAVRVDRQRCAQAGNRRAGTMGEGARAPWSVAAAQSVCSALILESFSSPRYFPSRSPTWRVDVALKLARLGCGNQSQSGSQSP